MGMEDRIKKLSKKLTGSTKEKAEKIQQMLLWDINSHVPLQFIIDNMEK
jgi:hypothetical protein